MKMSYHISVISTWLKGITQNSFEATHIDVVHFALFTASPARAPEVLRSRMAQGVESTY